MPGRGPQTFKKRQKEQERRERQQEKLAKRLQRKTERASGTGPDDDGIDWSAADPETESGGATFPVAGRNPLQEEKEAAKTATES